MGEEQPKKARAPAKKPAEKKAKAPAKKRAPKKKRVRLYLTVYVSAYI